MILLTKSRWRADYHHKLLIEASYGETGHFLSCFMLETQTINLSLFSKSRTITFSNPNYEQVTFIVITGNTYIPRNSAIMDTRYHRKLVYTIFWKKNFASNTNKWERHFLIPNSNLQQRLEWLTSRFYVTNIFSKVFNYNIRNILEQCSKMNSPLSTEPEYLFR